MKKVIWHPAPKNELGIHHYCTSSGNPMPALVLQTIYRDIIGPVHRVVVEQIRREVKAG